VLPSLERYKYLSTAFPDVGARVRQATANYAYSTVQYSHWRTEHADKQQLRCFRPQFSTGIYNYPRIGHYSAPRRSLAPLSAHPELEADNILSYVQNRSPILSSLVHTSLNTRPSRCQLSRILCNDAAVRPISCHSFQVRFEFNVVFAVVAPGSCAYTL
jgi:hypothetical protein